MYKITTIEDKDLGLFLLKDVALLNTERGSGLQVILLR